LHTTHFSSHEVTGDKIDTQSKSSLSRSMLSRGQPESSSSNASSSLKHNGKRRASKCEPPPPQNPPASISDPNDGWESYNPRARESAYSPGFGHTDIPRAESSQAGEDRRRQPNRPILPMYIFSGSDISRPVISPSPPLKICMTCMDDYDQDGFPARKITNRCNHWPSTCTNCLARWIESCLQYNGGNMIDCPDDGCEEELEYEDVREFANAKTFRRYRSPSKNQYKADKELDMTTS
jgi:hypothetical protein